MGACSNFMTIQTIDRAEIKKEFKEYVEELIYDYGHDPYNGTFSTCSGLTITSKTFENENEARDYILDHTEKWGDALAVTIKSDKGDYTLIGGWCAEWVL